ncbi:MAG: metallophosphoesterase family protein [Actinomycetota bacterium]|nr:metallophosphoesterase family protein [Actinomycetota bacterium]
MRRIALFSDIHGNLPALDAALADIEREGVDECYCLGDLVGYGPGPAAVIDRIVTLGIPTVLGNYDDGVGNDRGECGCYYATPQDRADGAASYAFTAPALDAEHKRILAELPREIRLAEDGARILLAHGSPRRINEYLQADRPDAQLLRLAKDAAADIVCVGHVHAPYHRVIDAGQGAGTLDSAPHVHYVNSGSVGKPKDGDPRACWVELVLGSADDVCSVAGADPQLALAGSTDVYVGVRVHRVGYDIEAVAAATVSAGLPAAFAEALRSG